MEPKTIMNAKIGQSVSLDLGAGSSVSYSDTNF